MFGSPLARVSPIAMPEAERPYRPQSFYSKIKSHCVVKSTPIQSLQQLFAQEQQSPIQTSKTKPQRNCTQRRLGHAVALAAAVFGIACCVAASASTPLGGTWSTANLSQARQGPAATSLPNHGVAIFAGGHIGANDPSSAYFDV
jgi:hypothetical protein